MKVKLVVKRYYKPIELEFDSVVEAIDSALAQCDSDVSYPDHIEVDGVRVWSQPGPFRLDESLAELRRRYEGA